MNRRQLLSTLFIALIGAGALYPATVHAATEGDFSLQVTPSPLVTTIKPGQATELELKIRNAGTTPQELVIGTRNFRIDSSTDDIKIDDTRASDVEQWVRFSEPSFTIEPGRWFTQKVTLAFPENSGFSYYFAVVINQKNTPQADEGGRLLQGSVAVFSLVNIDKPGATRKLDLTKLETTRRVYEYLPSEITVTFKNDGNSIIQPYGNIFIQRGTESSSPLGTLAVNESKGYILPGVSRSLVAQWSDGFPVVTTEPNGRNKVQWDWSKVSKFRIGKYTAKLVGVYNDGTRDVPIEGEVSFWVIPWKILAGFSFVGLLVAFGIWSLVRSILRILKGGRKGNLRL